MKKPVVFLTILAMSACGNVAEEKEQAQIIEKNDKNQAIENNDKNQTVEKNDKTQTTEKNDKTQTSEKNHDAHKEKPTSANTQKPVTSISPKDDPGMRVMVIDDGFNLVGLWCQHDFPLC